MSTKLFKSIKATFAATLFLIIVTLLSGCNSGSSVVSNLPRVNANGNLVGTNVFDETLSIQTGKMDGKPGWPRYVPANFTIPANTIIKLTIINYDDGTAPLPSNSPWSKFWGSDPTFGLVEGGDETVNGKKITSVDPNNVSHTFTVPSLLINLPIPAAVSKNQPAVVTFEFSVSKPGNYHWLCAAPCGSGSTGMGGAMNTSNWMEGTMEVK